MCRCASWLVLAATARPHLLAAAAAALCGRSAEETLPIGGEPTQHRLSAAGASRGVPPAQGSRRRARGGQITSQKAPSYGGAQLRRCVSC
eukprot:1176988-Prorocentrum_minimum.AAC.3